MKQKNRISTKDLINIGIYLAVYLVVVFVVGMMNAIPMLYPILLFIMPIIAGIPFMLFLSKVKKPGMLLIFSVILGLFWFVAGYTWIAFISCISAGGLGELILKAGNYQSFKFMALSYSIFSLWFIGCVLPIWVMSDTYMASVRDSMGDQYADALNTWMPAWMALAGLPLLFIGGLLGAVLGKKMLNKHFKKAGIV